MASPRRRPYHQTTGRDWSKLYRRVVPRNDWRLTRSNQCWRSVWMYKNKNSSIVSLDFHGRSMEEKVEQKYNRKIPNGGVAIPVIRYAQHFYGIVHNANEFSKTQIEGVGVDVYVSLVFAYTAIFFSVVYTIIESQTTSKL